MRRAKLFMFARSSLTEVPGRGFGSAECYPTPSRQCQKASRFPHVACATAIPEEFASSTFLVGALGVARVSSSAAQTVGSPCPFLALGRGCRPLKPDSSAWRRRSCSSVSMTRRRPSKMAAIICPSAGVSCPHPTACTTALTAAATSAAVVTGPTLNLTGCSFRGDSKRSIHRRRAVGSPCRARSAHFLVMASPWPSSSFCRAMVALFRLPCGRPRPNELPG